MLVAVYIAAQLGVWEMTLLKDTLYWLVPGYILLFGAVNAATEKGFFRRRVREAVGLTAFFAFYLTVATLDLGWELILVPLLTLLSLISAFGGGRKRSSPRDGDSGRANLPIGGHGLPR